MGVTEIIIELGIVFGFILSVILVGIMIRYQPTNSLERAFIFREFSLALSLFWAFFHFFFDLAFNYVGALGAIGLIISAVWIAASLYKEYQKECLTSLDPILHKK